MSTIRARVSRAALLPRAHRAFTVLLLLGIIVRIVVALAYPLPWLYPDSYSYLEVANHPQPLWGFQPSGYPFFLWLLKPFHSLVLVSLAQHFLGIVAGVASYVLLRRARVRAWISVAASTPLLLDAQFIQAENSVLSDSLFLVLVVMVLATTIPAKGTSIAPHVACGLLLACAALTRTIGLLLIAVLLVHTLVTGQRRWRAAGALVLAAALPLTAYATWYHHNYGRYTLAGGDGIALWARTMTFADCTKISPPSNLRPLCPNGHHQDAASEYVWAADSPLNRTRGGFANNDKARSFALCAIIAQPIAYTAAVGRDTALAFAWTPARHPRRVTPAFGFVQGSWPAGQNGGTRPVHAYDPSARTVRSVEPTAAAVRWYQHPAYTRGPLLLLLLLLGMAGVVTRRKKVATPLIVGLFLLVGPVAVLDFDHRYVMAAIPAITLAAALALEGFLPLRPRPPQEPNTRGHSDLRAPHSPDARSTEMDLTA
ncbi:hypothetical protein [Actinomadura rupiterrae]|uniref:hypothetical protein n=1 Tax=Actinomadura rupiterrae TaxID=559627 RepID=UPI0020A24B2C|nr:hypothetical protein [Actinomadura rupiterrae]MCP2337332.1 hypothetical protein [Actinomadura rupiterrae]